MDRKPISFAKVFTLLGVGFFVLLIVSTIISERRLADTPNNDEYYVLNSNSTVQVESSIWDIITIYYNKSDDDNITFGNGMLKIKDSDGNIIHNIMITVDSQILDDMYVEVIDDPDELGLPNHDAILKIKVRQTGEYSFITFSTDGFERNDLFAIGFNFRPNIIRIIFVLLSLILLFTLLKIIQIRKGRISNYPDIIDKLIKSKHDPNEDPFAMYDKDSYQ